MAPGFPQHLKSVLQLPSKCNTPGSLRHQQRPEEKALVVGDDRHRRGRAASRDGPLWVPAPCDQRLPRLDSARQDPEGEPSLDLTDSVGTRSAPSLQKGWPLVYVGLRPRPRQLYTSRALGVQQSQQGSRAMCEPTLCTSCSHLWKDRTDDKPRCPSWDKGAEPPRPAQLCLSNVLPW